VDQELDTTQKFHLKLLRDNIFVHAPPDQDAVLKVIAVLADSLVGLTVEQTDNK
jgi:hypothetical protein